VAVGLGRGGVSQLLHPRRYIYAKFVLTFKEISFFLHFVPFFVNLSPGFIKPKTGLSRQISGCLISPAEYLRG